MSTCRFFLQLMFLKLAYSHTHIYIYIYIYVTVVIKFVCLLTEIWPDKQMKLYKIHDVKLVGLKTVSTVQKCKHMATRRLTDIYDN